MTPEQVLQLPAYLGMIMLGALSPDHIGLSMDQKDVDRYPILEQWKQQRKHRQRNLNAIG
jgi:hypothetical protein